MSLQKKQLYESIMRSVSLQVKKALNEVTGSAKIGKKEIIELLTEKFNKFISYMEGSINVTALHLKDEDAINMEQKLRKIFDELTNADVVVSANKHFTEKSVSSDSYLTVYEILYQEFDYYDTPKLWNITDLLGITSYYLSFFDLTSDASAYGNSNEGLARLLTLISNNKERLTALGFNTKWLVEPGKLNIARLNAWREKHLAERYKSMCERALEYLVKLEELYGGDWTEDIMQVVSGYGSRDLTDFSTKWSPSYINDRDNIKWAIVRTKTGFVGGDDGTDINLLPVCAIPILPNAVIKSFKGINDMDDLNIKGEINLIGKAANYLKFLYMLKVNKMIDPAMDRYPTKFEKEFVRYSEVRPIKFETWNTLDERHKRASGEDNI